jgi:protein subunit release factor B
MDVLTLMWYRYLWVQDLLLFAQSAGMRFGVMTKELLFSVTKKDFDIQTFRSGGKGGQNQNKVSSGVRIVHRDSGAVGESRRERSQLQNKRLALQHLVANPKFRVWINKKAYEALTKKSIDKIIEEQMKPENLKTEIMKNGEWKENR